ncbi:hypothetical protein ALO42_102546 [Pseudomonas syringae pv. atrofaciens]|uniref:Uncharacterized protein n=3 Tax=Pseudomonas syringae group TaxID=136849 RepID=A0A3M4XYP4_9PSED|nr:hypothetical protein ALO42_102546 [Pseudomonas syringae pv. atrofaciens]KPX64629.1 hypothetical protein ALO39_102005 [Pseudomonas syringae pv. lapsa]KPY68879.1 hypothetical protein ALO45_102009 [Pseudomonas syringae pv. syringae]KPY98372.1 hypothetical protein ALO85_101791 [Pseudomonas syringae pv. aptata]RMM28919.1 hypothetical protein ALQ81_102075 [Pseudomonas syringae pv. pisi]RMN73838.1 hypothetical protein ALQ54_101663 [Pseudomonas syringae]RMR80702.1 hypothetical protein ALP78_102201
MGSARSNLMIAVLRICRAGLIVERTAGMNPVLLSSVITVGGPTSGLDGRMQMTKRCIKHVN